MGTGKILIQAFLQFKNLRYIFGIELSAGRYKYVICVLFCVLVLCFSCLFDSSTGRKQTLHVRLLISPLTNTIIHTALHRLAEEALLRMVRLLGEDNYHVQINPGRFIIVTEVVRVSEEGDGGNAGTAGDNGYGKSGSGKEEKSEDGDFVNGGERRGLCCVIFLCVQYVILKVESAH